ncbi:hypothetical protein QTP70_000308 [Hemibagrus guttatus]|uniref:Mismatch repair endonuclease PMS2 n=1 Tax=Hemibagrus guttatus TaxID=175788 RepID=A0AAE0QPV4_9TELE|nr:hypothetical protein QTP70_000308 [Hemibagrus guttatus]KAK3558970.1 hypothetical protein QTP86_000014 [Hemibagrus guttatus]
MTDSSSEPARAIRAIDKRSVHQICSGQVVLTLATAVKELVENSIDAGATQVDIRLKENGTELVEVSDNGRGVEEENFEGLTLKHHTSKLRDFSDLIHVETFGFRGEALSSLCALSDLSVVTCHESSHVGTRLVYDHNGRLVQRAPHPRQQGTTVSLQQLFSTLPVRHKEFQRNIKKEFSKMVHVLQSYCIISTGVRITCTNQLGQGKRNTVMCTSGSQNMRDNIGALFGPKQLQSLLPFQQISPNEGVKEDYGLTGEELPIDLFNLFGSKPDAFSFLVRYIWAECVDVNVTPDKRQIFLQEEKLLLATLKSSLIAMYETGVNKISLNYTPQFTGSFSRCGDSAKSPEGPWKASLPSKDGSETLTQSPKTSFNLAGLKAAFSKQQDTKTSNSNSNGPTQKKMQSFFHCSEKTNYSRPSDTASEKAASSLKSDLSKHEDVEADSGLSEQSSITQTPDTLCGSSCEFDSPDSVLEEHGIKSQPYNEPVDEVHDDLEAIEQETISVINPEGISSPRTKKCRWDVNLSEQLQLPSSSTSSASCGLFDKPVSVQKKTVPLQFSMADLVKRMERLKTQKKKQNDQELKYRRFRAKINPGENQSAEDELKKEISKDMFKEMEIIGQFNLGFIVTKLKSDLFIIDQHATDEKYNFEMLQQHTVLKGQRLIAPQNLHLPAVSETILIENLEIFKKNGFEFLIDENAPVMERVKLISVPTSKNWTFGPSDIEELIFMLSDSPGVMCRPSRVRQMFASRACRKSVMIGTALNPSEMKKLVVHMGEIEQPWNCPHGRPTIRHLLNLDVISQD